MARTYTCKVYICKETVDYWGAYCELHQKQRNYIPDGGINEVIADWHGRQKPRNQTVASPSSVTQCPKVVWYNKHKIPRPNEMGWGKKQRNMLGRIAENLFAEQLKDAGKLLHHWKDDFEGESDKFGMGEGLTRNEGTPDLLIKYDKVLISDSKTSRADAFLYVPIDIEEAWEDELWHKNKLQLETYFLLCHKNKDWFDKHKLPLPEECHLFSYALDDGVVKREFTWLPTNSSKKEILDYTIRWNTAYQSETEPECVCTATQTKFCPFAYEFETTNTGYKLGTACCHTGLNK